MENDYIFPQCETVQREEDERVWYWKQCIEEARNSGAKLGTLEFWLIYRYAVYESHGKYGFCVAGFERLAEELGVSVAQIKDAHHNACRKGRLFHIWCDRRAYRNKTKIYVTKKWLQDRNLDPELLVVQPRGKKNERLVTSEMTNSGEIVGVKMAESASENAQKLSFLCLKTGSKNPETGSKNPETGSKNPAHPLMNNIKRTSKSEYISKKESTQVKMQSESYEDILDKNGVDGELREAFLEFVKSRKLNGHKMTNRALELAIKKVRKMESTEERQVAVVEQSIMSGWSGLFPLKEEVGAKQSQTQNQNQVVKSEIYQPQDGEDITYQRMFDVWKQVLGVSQPQTVGNVEACKDLLADIGEDWVVKMIMALRMRGQTRFVIREIKGIQDFAGLAENRSAMMGFYDEHRTEWELKIREIQTGKKPWEA